MDTGRVHHYLIASFTEWGFNKSISWKAKSIKVTGV